MNEQAEIARGPASSGYAINAEIMLKRIRAAAFDEWMAADRNRDEGNRLDAWMAACEFEGKRLSSSLEALRLALIEERDALEALDAIPQPLVLPL